MGDAERICYIHIGTHKTGTTSIQRFLGSNREQFAAAGVFFPTSGSDCWPGDASHHQLAHELNGAPRFDPKHGGLDAVAADLRSSGARVACLSSEDLTFLWNNKPGLVRLRDAVLQAGFMPRIVVYLRPQASYCTAVYAETLRHGFRLPFSTYLNDVLTKGHYIWNGGSGPPFDYGTLLDPFAEVFGRESIIARRYRTNAPDNALLFDFSRLLVGPDETFKRFAEPAVRENGSLDFGSVLRLLGERGSIEDLIRFTPLNVMQTLLFERRFAAPNARLKRRYGVHVPSFELLDLALASPLRRTPAKMRTLASARRALTRNAPSASRMPVEDR